MCNMNSHTHSFIDWLNSNLLKEGRTVSGLAEELGYARPHLSRILNGKTAVSKKFAERCEAILGVDAGEILSRQSKRELSGKTIKPAKRPTHPLYEIRASEITAWANGLNSRSRFAVLLRKLVHETDRSTSLVDFPGNDQSQKPGWDGRIISELGNTFVPKGETGWEFGVNVDPKTKADGDYDQRVKNCSEDERLATTFVFVTPRIWPGKTNWEAEKRAEGLFKDVRVFDADNLEQWMEIAPSTQAWFCGEVGIPIGNVAALSDIWRQWQVDRADILGASLFREACLSWRKELIKWLERPNGSLTIMADSSLEATALVAALSANEQLLSVMLSGEKPNDQTKKEIASDNNRTETNEKLDLIRATLDRLVVFSQADDIKRHLSAATTILPIVTTTSADEALASVAPELPFIRVLSRGAPAPEVRIVIDPLSYIEFRNALEHAGLPENEVKQLDGQTGRSLTILRRRLSKRDGVTQPAWKNDANSRLLASLALVSRFDANNESDRVALELIINGSFDDIESQIAAIAEREDSPIWVIGSQIGIKSQVDVLFAVGSNLTLADIKRFFNIAAEILTERDPELDLPEDERMYAALHGKTRQFSGGLRKGIASGATVAATFADGVFSDRVSEHVPRLARRLSTSLLTPWDVDTIKSVNDILPIVAELDPDNFVSILEKDLADKKVTFSLLTPIDASIFGSRNYRTGLLWALETLAWSPKYYTRVADILATLSTQEIDDNWVNKPINTLMSLFRSWLPQTTVDLASRKTTFDRIWDNHPEIAWNIASSEVIERFSSASPNSTPAFRDFAHGYQRVTNADVYEFRRYCFELCLGDPSPTAEKLSDLLDIVDLMADEDEIVFWDKAISWAKNADDEARLFLRDTLRRRTRSRFAAKRKREKGEHTFDEAKANELYEALKPRDQVADILWLFKDYWVEHGQEEDLDEDWKDRDERVRVMRKTIFETLFKNEGLDTISELVERCGAPHVVGNAFADNEPSLSDFVEVCRYLLENCEEESAIQSFLSGAMHRTNLCREEIYKSLSSHSKSDLLKWAAIGSPFEAMTWDALKAYPNIEKKYWKNARSRWANDGMEAARAAREFLDAGRPAAAFEVLSREFKDVDATLVEEVLDEMSKSDVSDTDRGMLGHNLEKAFEALRDSDLIPFERLLALEYRYLTALQETRYGIPSVEKSIETDPTSLIQALSFIYRRDDDGKDPEGYGSNEELRPGFGAAMYRFLNKWNYIPGQDEVSEAEKAETLSAWIDRAFKLGKAIARGKITSSKIGEIVGKSAAADGDLWPAQWIADALEPRMDDEMISGFYVGKRNSRGVHGFTSGGEERRLAEGFQYAADFYRSSHPKLCIALEKLAESYAFDSKRDKQRGELKKRVE